MKTPKGILLDHFLFKLENQTLAQVHNIVDGHPELHKPILLWFERSQLGKTLIYLLAYHFDCELFELAWLDVGKIVVRETCIQGKDKVSHQPPCRKLGEVPKRGLGTRSIQSKVVKRKGSSPCSCSCSLSSLGRCFSHRRSRSRTFSSFHCFCHLLLKLLNLCYIFLSQLMCVLLVIASPLHRVGFDSSIDHPSRFSERNLGKFCSKFCQLSVFQVLHLGCCIVSIIRCSRVTVLGGFSTILQNSATYPINHNTPTSKILL
mmetsp:Transcript_742/g.1929  ORF Transcript_742/g.1929 Transcript_742/m.1929 type:complete len:261 (-) Transcript_742:92-874(-)